LKQERGFCRIGSLACGRINWRYEVGAARRFLHPKLPTVGSREYHHLFPDAHLTRMGVPDDRIYLSLNCALVTWQTNRNISGKPPEHYLAERWDGTGLGETEIKARLATHLVPFDEMVKNDYPAFLEKRGSIVHGVMKTLCSTGGT